MGKVMSCKLSVNPVSLFLTVASYLAISDFYPIGEEQRSNASTGLRNISTSADESNSGPLDQASPKDENERDEVETTSPERSPPGDGPAKADQSAMTEPKKRKRAKVLMDLDPDLITLPKKSQKLHETSSAKMVGGRGHDDEQPRSSDDHLHSASTPNLQLPQQNITRARASVERGPLHLQLSTLASVTGANVTRNKQVNILAMVEHVNRSTVKPTTAPLKRDVRIVDPSTDKKVTLSVFVDPVNFIPNEYDIILFRGLTTHDFSGGNLNAYPKKCKGKEWYVLDPYDIEECDMDSMEEFRAHYRKTKVQRP